jgi:muramoyltetrapeptide carboxypeptidase
MSSLTLYTPAGVLTNSQSLRRAEKRLTSLGFDVSVDEAALAKEQRFGGSDAVRLEAIHRIAREAPSVALASRGGYGLTRLLDQLDWKLIGRSVERGTRWVGQSDLTSLQLGLLHHVKASTWAGPLACEDFGRSDAEGGVDDVTEACFVEAMGGQLEAIGFRTDSAHDGLEVRGTLWGGNLCVLNSMLGTPHFPRVKGGILFLEDINEHPYRVERGLLQLQQAGVIDAQRAVVLGDFSGWKKSPLDRGYGLKCAIDALRSRTATPILTGLPFGHIPTKVCLPIGVRAEMTVQGRDALLAWAH